MVEPNPIATIIMLPIALFAYCWRHGTALGWYRGCGWFPSTERGSVNSSTGATT